ncbi:ABC transporter substrate-binding protein [Calditerricola satsumensis]|uniref:ABC transporter substrate-binding protein n=1 Tax=Calditerricola satsumensis TaxID=373054 RepID=A0A8J3BC48_9BACI|nr:ABC transporter substrate-binding protein [Calditerricola satsumensis]GGK03105.1 ABC transporter substrate-binding protein [Calditerricola satsumensis]
MRHGWKAVVLVFILLLLPVGLAACQSEKPASPGNAAEEVASGKPVTYPLTVRDDSGAEVTVQKEPQRIVSLIPSHTETLFALGLEGKVVAVTKWDNYPPDVQKKVEHVFQDGLNPPTEELLSLKPDLVVLGSHNKETVDALRKAGLTVVVYDPQSLKDVYRVIGELGKITNRTKEAKQVIDRMKAKEQAIREKVQAIPEKERVRVYVEADPDQLYTAGKNTFMDELIQLAGGRNIAHDLEGWQKISAETVIQRNPQVIVVTYGYYVPNAADKPKQRAGWNVVDAVREGRVYALDSDLISRPGPRIVDGAEALAKAFYPDRFR